MVTRMARFEFVSFNGSDQIRTSKRQAFAGSGLNWARKQAANGNQVDRQAGPVKNQARGQRTGRSKSVAKNYIVIIAQDDDCDRSWIASIER